MLVLLHGKRRNSLVFSNLNSYFPDNIEFASFHANKQNKTKMANATEQQAAAAAPVEEKKGEKALAKDQEPETTTPDAEANGHVKEANGAAAEEAEDVEAEAEDDVDEEDVGEDDEDDEEDDGEENPLKRKVDDADEECLKKPKTGETEEEAAVEA